MSRGPEARIQDAVIKYAKMEHDALCKKNETGRYNVQPGYPDWTIYPVKRPAFLIEFKAPGEKLKPLQAFYKAELERRGHTVHVVDNIAVGKRLIDRECK